MSKRKLNLYGWSQETMNLEKQYGDAMGKFLFSPNTTTANDFIRMEKLSEDLRQSKYDDIYDSDGKLRAIK